MFRNNSNQTYCFPCRIPNACPDDLEELALTVDLKGASKPLKPEEEAATAGARGLLGPLRERLCAFARSLKEA